MEWEAQGNPMKIEDVESANKPAEAPAAAEGSDATGSKPSHPPNGDKQA